MKPIRLLLVDDEAPVRRGLHMLLDLEPDIEIAGEAEDGAEALRLAEALAQAIHRVAAGWEDTS